MSSTDESYTSCSDCKFELYIKVWTKLLLDWVNKCSEPDIKAKKLLPICLSYVMTKYKNDVCHTDLDKALVCTDDIEPFLEYKYPILRLRNLCEASDYPRKQYIMMSVLLYYCCTNSEGMIDKDICKHLNDYEQELILKFCENLSEMEITVNNVDTAIKGAFEYINEKNKIKLTNENIIGLSSSDSDTKFKKLISTSVISDVTSDDKSQESTVIKRTSITVMPSVITNSSNCSVSSENTSETATDCLDVYSFPKVQNTQDLDRKRHHRKSSGVIRPSRYTSEAQKAAEEVMGYKKIDESPRFAGGRIGETRVARRPRSRERTLDPFRDENRIKSSPGYHRSSKRRIDGSLKSRRLQDASIEASVEGLRCKTSNCAPPCKCPPTPSSLYGALDSSSRVEVEAQTAKISSFNVRDKVSHVMRFYREDIQDRWKKVPETTRKYVIIIACLLIVVIFLAALIPYLVGKRRCKTKDLKLNANVVPLRQTPAYVQTYFQCKNKMCVKVLAPINSGGDLFTSFSRCSLICLGPQLWPYPIGYTMFSNKIVAISTKKLEYKFQSIPSESVQNHLAEAFKLFIGDLVRLERTENMVNATEYLKVFKMHIQLDVDSDPDPRLRLNTEESYYLKVETVHEKVYINLSSASFCGVRHGLQTLSQMVILDQSSNKLITLQSAVVKDAPSYKYRGLMIDTGRNYIPMTDLMRTIDAMAMVKLNTFHWRISDVTSFPLYLPSLTKLFEYGAYDRSMTYTKEDVISLVRRARVRGIRVLIEVTAPGPVGRAWSWHPDATCPQKTENFTCSHVLCTRLQITVSILNLLQEIYAEILEMTSLDDVFHLSDSIFSIGNCYYLLEDRQGFLEKALERLKMANNGFVPKLPIVWYTTHLNNDIEGKLWVQYGVQLDEIPQDQVDSTLSNFKAIHSSKWDLSCELIKLRCTKYRTWQEMYNWKSWRNVETFSIEGGEAILWTDMVNSGNIDTHIWPRAAAVAERLWSDIIANISITGNVYERLDSQRWRMLLHGVNVQSVWPLWCSFNPATCLEKLK